MVTLRSLSLSRDLHELPSEHFEKRSQKKRNRERQRETERDRERQRDTERHRETQRDTEGHRDTESERDIVNKVISIAKIVKCWNSLV